MIHERWFVALLACLPLAALAYRFRAVSTSGVVAGVAIAVILATSQTAAPLAVFLVFVVIGSASSRFGRATKKDRGVMQADEGRRTALHAVANAGPAAVIVLVAKGTSLLSPDTADVLATTALAAMLADTSASEWGTWLGGEPRSILSFRRVPYGADGGVTLAGSIAALIAASISAGVAAAVGRTDGRALVAVTVGAFLGNVVDSVLGATIERHLGRHSGAWVNALASVAGALIGGACYRG